MQTHLPFGLSGHTATECEEPLPWRQRITRAVRRRIHREALRQKVLGEFDELMTMSDHMLRDIGLTRDQVRASRHQFRRNGVLPGREC